MDNQNSVSHDQYSPQIVANQDSIRIQEAQQEVGNLLCNSHVADQSQSQLKMDPQRQKEEMSSNASKTSLKKASALKKTELLPLNILQSKSFVSLQNNKYIKVIFQHFCKNNQLKTFKSSTFDQKQKIFNLMDLNKWMIFCKEYQFSQFLIENRLSRIEHKQNQSPSKFQLASSKIQADRSFANIFKKVSQNGTEMDLTSFIKALSLFYEILFEEKSVESLQKFNKKVLHCNSEKNCLDKLSDLKIKFATPHLATQKVRLSQSNLLIKYPKGDRVFYKLNEAKFELNKIVSQARQQTSKQKSCHQFPQNRRKIDNLSKQAKEFEFQKLKENHINLQRPSEIIKKIALGKDDILDSYLSKESFKNKHVINK